MITNEANKLNTYKESKTPEKVNAQQQFSKSNDLLSLIANKMGLSYAIYTK
ncbi:MAG: hypothetical protein MJK04_00735 [Psychrosphaera sp.]|nr:hypothetical protein [Psychrosphaera sp.]